MTICVLHDKLTEKVHRQSLERYTHAHHFEKQALLWAEPRLRTPAQFERWSQVVAIVHNQLVLARPLVQAMLRPWETSQRPASPQQVRRAMAKIVAQLGTPARSPQPRGNRQGDQKVRLSDLRHAIRWSTSPNLGRKSGANALEGLNITVIVDPFRTMLLFTSEFG